MFSFLFVEKGELFLKKSSFEEFNLAFFTAKQMVCFEMQPRPAKFLLNFQVLFALYGQENTNLKENLSREDQGDREGIPHTHLIPQVIRLELFVRHTDPKGD